MVKAVTPKIPTLGRLVRRLRREQHLTQSELAIRAGLAQSVVSRIESGEAKHFRAETVEALASALAVAPEALMTGTARWEADRPLRMSMTPVARSILLLLQDFDQHEQVAALGVIKALADQRKSKAKEEWARREAERREVAARDSGPRGSKSNR